MRAWAPLLTPNVPKGPMISCTPEPGVQLKTGLPSCLCKTQGLHLEDGTNGENLKHTLDFLMAGNKTLKLLFQKAMRVAQGLIQGTRKQSLMHFTICFLQMLGGKL